jgi:hypothetical protein
VKPTEHKGIRMSADVVVGIRLGLKTSVYNRSILITSDISIDSSSISTQCKQQLNGTETHL